MRNWRDSFTLILVTMMLTNLFLMAELSPFSQRAEAQGLQLRVSAAERSEFQNHFFGAQIVQIIIDDPGATDPDESTVGLTVLGNSAQRVHLADGLWYSFVAEDQGFGIVVDVLSDGVRNNRIAVSDLTNDSGLTATIGGTVYNIDAGVNDSFVKEIEFAGGLPFIEVNEADIFTILPQPFFEGGTTINPDLRIGGVEGNGSCELGVDDAGSVTLSTGTGTGDPDCDWPYIRLVGLEELDTMEVRAGTASVVLTFDDFAESIASKLDRATDYPLNAEVIIQYTDFMWNINPVEEDGVFFVLDPATGRPTNIIYQPVGGFDPGGNGQNFADVLPVFTSSPGMEFDERQVLELDQEGVQVIRFSFFFDTSAAGANNVIGQFVASPFTLISENARPVSQFDDPNGNGNPAEIEAFAVSATAATIDPAADDRPVVRMFETDPNTSVLISTVEPQGGRSVIFTGVNDRVASFDYFDIINSAPMTTHDGFTSVDGEFYDSADRAVFTVTDPDKNLRSRISEEPTGRDSSTFIRIGNPFPLVNTRNQPSGVNGISNTLIDNIERIWVAAPLPATGDATTFGIDGGEGLNVLADANNDGTLAITAATGTERFHAQFDDIVQATISNNNRRIAAVFTPPDIGGASTIVIDTRQTIDDINDVLTLTGITGAQILGQTYVDNLQDVTFDQLENFLVQVAEIDTTPDSPTTGILGRDVVGPINPAVTYEVRMPRYNLINLDLTDLTTTAPFASAVVKIEAVDPLCIPAAPLVGPDTTASTLAFDNDQGALGGDDECVHASQIVDFQIVEGAPSVDTDATTSAGSGDNYDTSVNVAGVAGVATGLPWNTLDAAGTAIGFDRDSLPGRVGVGAFRPLDFEDAADANFGGDHLLDRIRVTIMLLDAGTGPSGFIEPAEVISPGASQVVVVDIGGLGTVFQPAPDPTIFTSLAAMQGSVTTPDAAESPFGHAFSNLVYRLELDEEGSNSSIFKGRADFMTFFQFDTVPDALNEIVLTGDPLKIWLPNRFIPPNRLALANLDEDIVQFFREVSATFIYETRDGSVEWDRSSFSFGQDAFLTIRDEDLNRRPDATERYNLPLDSFVFLELGKVRVDTVCTLGTTDCFFNQIDATLLETGPNTGTFVSQIRMPKAIKVDATPGLPASAVSQTTQQRDLEANYIDIRDRSSVRQEFDHITNIRTNLGQINIDRSVYPPGPGFEPGTLLDKIPKVRLVGAIMYIEIVDAEFNLDPDIRDVLDMTQIVDFSTITGNPADLRDIVQIKIFDGGGSTPVIYSANPFSSVFFGGKAFPILDRNLNSVTQAIETGPNTNTFEFEFQIYCPDINPSIFAPFLPVCTNKVFTIPVFKSNSPIEVIFNDPSDESGSPEDVEGSAVVQTQTAVIGSNKKDYQLGETATIFIIEPDFNLDSRTIEILDFNLVGITTNKTPVEELPLGILLDALRVLGEFSTTELGFREAQPNAGIFGIIVPEGAVDETVVSRGEEVEIVYRDQTPSGGGGEIRVEYEVLVKETVPEIIFDKEEYTPFDEVSFRIVSPDSNDEPLQIQRIKVRVSTSSTGGFLLNVPETGPNTGIFEEDFDLTPNSELLPGDLVAIREDGLSAEFRIDEDTVMTKSVFINYHVGNIMFDRDAYAAIDRAVIRVIDPDENKSPDTIDTVDARIWSTSDRGGLLVKLRETGDRTGIFEEFVTFTTDEESTGTRLRALVGDTITAKYTDRTLPAPAALASDGVFTVEVGEIFSSALIGASGPPIERSPASEPVFVNQDGERFKEISVGQQVMVQSEISNMQTIKQRFAYIVQIKDIDGVTLSLSWISGELSPNEKILAAQSWIPSITGEYTIEVFVWDSVDKPVALSPVRSAQVNVF